MNQRSKISSKRIIVLGLVFATFLLWESAAAQSILTLEQSIEIAKTSSPDINKSNLNLLSNQKSLDAQRASLKSRFSLDLTPITYGRDRAFSEQLSGWITSESYQSFGLFNISQPISYTDGTISLSNESGYRDNSSTFGSAGRTKSYYNNLRLRIDQPIFTYNRNKLQLAELELNLENAQLSNAMQLLSLERNVTQAFYTFYQAQNSVEIAQDEYENQQISYDITKNKVDADLLAEEELYQAELNLATSKSTLQNARVTVSNAADDFKLMIGMDLSEPVKVEVDINFITQKVNLNKAIQNGLDQRMELRQRSIDIERSQFELIRTNAQNEFKGSVSLSLGLLGDNAQPENVFDNTQRTPRVAISFSIPLWDWGEKKARLAAATANQKISEIDLENEKNTITINIRKVYRNLQNLETQIEIAEQNVKNAELTYEINLERYQNGDLTSMDLNQFQNQLSDKKSALANSLINYKIELLNLKIQSLYDFENNQPVVPQTYE